MSRSILNLVWKRLGSNFTGWVGIGAENLSREDLYWRVSRRPSSKGVADGGVAGSRDPSTFENRGGPSPWNLNI